MVFGTITVFKRKDTVQGICYFLPQFHRSEKHHPCTNNLKQKPQGVKLGNNSVLSDDLFGRNMTVSKL